MEKAYNIILRLEKADYMDVKVKTVGWSDFCSVICGILHDFGGHSGDVSCWASQGCMWVGQNPPPPSVP